MKVTIETHEDGTVYKGFGGVEDGGVYNACSSCGTVNWFDKTDANLFAKGHCYHCGDLVSIPDYPEHD